MLLFSFFLWIVWAAGAYIWSRKYHFQRHGVPFDKNVGSLLISMAWPVTIFTHRDPEFCNHPEHIIARQHMREQIQRQEETLERARRAEGRS